MEPLSSITGINQQLSPIQSLSGVTESLTSDLKTEEEGDSGKKMSFAQLVNSQIIGVNNALNQSVSDKDKLIRGELKDTHQVAISGTKAGIMLRLTTSICSKVSSACTTLFQMQI